MAKKAECPEAYFEGCKAENRRTLELLFGKAREALPGHEVTMKYGFPLLDGHGKFGVAERSDGIAVFFHHHGLAEAVETAGPTLGTFRIGRESLRYRRAAEVPVDAVVALATRLFRG